MEVDPTLVGQLLLDRGPEAGLVGVLLYSFRQWWMSVQEHLCKAIPQALRIAEKLANDGIDVRLSVTLRDADDE